MNFLLWKKYFNNFKDLNLLLYLRGNILSVKVLVKKRTFLNIHNISKIVVKNTYLILNKKYLSNDPFSLVYLKGYNSDLIVEKTLFFYSGSKIIINDNSKLILGFGYLKHNLI